jgi:hypothetical protein
MADGTPKRRRKRPSTSDAERSADVFRGDETLADLRAAVDLVAAAGERPARTPPGDTVGRPPLDQACRVLLEIIRRRCPGLLPDDPLPPGRPADPVPVEPKEAAVLVKLAARQAAVVAGGLPIPPSDDQLPGMVLWQKGADELLVEVGALDLELGDGTVTVTVPVRCEEIARRRARISIAFAVGSPDRPTGMLTATTEPLGPAVVVRRWSEELTALAWQAVLDSLGGVAAATGRDEDGSPLIPVAITASPAGLAVLAQARHPIDRVRPGPVVGRPTARGARPP